MSRSRAAGAWRIALLGIVALAAAVVSAGAQETVTISVPLAVSFPVTDVSRSTSGTPNVTTDQLFEREPESRQGPPGERAAGCGGVYAAERLEHAGLERVMEQPWGEWRHRHGTGRSVPPRMRSCSRATRPRTSGHIDLGWTLAAPGSGIRAGNHQLTIRWKVESITP